MTALFSSPDPPRCTAALSGDLTIASAAGLRDVLLAACAGGDVTADLGEVTRIDAAGVQLLAAAAAGVASRGGVFRTGPVSEAARITIERAGFGHWIDHAVPFAPDARSHEGGPRLQNGSPRPHEGGPRQ
ncbi:MAG: STAS domain-containing protein [Bryobacteraceae bacterium]